MARPSANYEPRRPAGSVLHQIVQDHLETFLSQAARLRDGDGVPRFVEHAFRAFLRCGFLAGGFARFHCGDCGLDRLVAFSCKGRALTNLTNVRAAVVAAWPNVPRIWSIASSLTYRFDSGC